MRYLDVPSEKITIVYQTCGAAFKTALPTTHLQAVCAKYDLPPEFLLYVGSIIERKNLLTLLKAIRLLPKSVQMPLVVVGQGRGAYAKNIQQYIHKNGMNHQIIFPKGVPNADLPAIYQAAQLFCYPSLYEGFGIPLLEALHSRIPVLTSPESSMPEAAGPGSFYADPLHPEALAQQMEKALTDASLRKHAVETGMKHASQFDAQVLTEQLIGVYHSVLGI